MRTYNNHRGFTLIELSIVLVIIGMLVGLGANLIGPLTTFVKVRETRDIQDAAIQSITSWAASRNTIPNDALFASAAKSPLDAWGRNMVYLYDTNLYTASPTKDTICGRRSAALTLVTTDPAATMANVAFAVLSGAENASFKSTLNGLAITVSAAATGTITVTGPNSDLVRWVTLDELRSKIGCQGAPLKILNNELTVASKADGYSNVILYADGGVPIDTNKYKWCISALPLGFTVSGGISDADCRGLADNDAKWAAAAVGLTITAAPNAATSGSYQITVVARDNADNATNVKKCSDSDPGDNCAQKTFVLTVNP